MYDEIDRMLALGVIEESNSAWNSPVVLVRKPGKVRLCLDSRKVNAVTKKDAYPLPNIDGLLSRLQNVKYISGIDLKDAFWQIPLEQNSREKTAFTVPGRPLYHFRVMPFGLCNSPQRMCRLMEKVIPAKLREKVFVYLDDLLVISADFKEHMSLLKEVAKCLSEAGLTINVEKSKFCLRKLRYLGHVVGEDGLIPDPEKVSAINEFPVPKSLKQCRRFLGMTGWYRKFIENYATLAAPITDCTRSSKVFKWTDEANLAFNTLKEKLTSAPVLVNPDFSKEFYIQCDASKVGIGGVLFQLGNDGSEHPIAYVSQKLNKCQRNYSVTELECLAAITCIKKFRLYVEGFKFTVITDHASLKWLMGQSDLSGRLARWSLKLQGYDFEIKHRKGSLNVVPDSLSRAFIEELISNLVDTELDLDSDAFTDEDYIQIVREVQAKSNLFPDLKVENGKIFKRIHFRGESDENTLWKLWVPRRLRVMLVKSVHESSTTFHGGINVTWQHISQKYFWPKMFNDVREVVLNCESCKECKASNTASKPIMTARFVSERPFQRLYTDVLGPYPRSKLGNTCILITVDHFSKYVFLKAVRQATAKNIVAFFEHDILPQFGVPQFVHSDNGKQYVGHEFQSFLKTFGITHIRTAIYSPQANASERVNRVILECVRSYLEDNQKDWDKNLHLVATSLRNRVHSSTNASPYNIVFGFPMVLHASTYKILKLLNEVEEGENISLPLSLKTQLLRQQVAKNLEKAYDTSAFKYNTRAKAFRFKVGQELFRRNFTLSDAKREFNAKLAKKYIKCRVRETLGNNLYVVEDLKGKLVGTYHGKDLKPF